MLTRDHTVLPATHTLIHKWNEPYLPLLPSRRASPHFGWYSFPVPLRVGGWVRARSTRVDGLLLIMLLFCCVVLYSCLFFSSFSITWWWNKVAHYHVIIIFYLHGERLGLPMRPVNTVVQNESRVLRPWTRVVCIESSAVTGSRTDDLLSRTSTRCASTPLCSRLSRHPVVLYCVWSTYISRLCLLLILCY